MTAQAINAALEQIDETTKKKLGSFRWKIAFSNPQKKEKQMFLFFFY